MNAILGTILALVLIANATAEAEESQSVYMLAKGGGEKRTWWGLVKLRNFEERDYGKYHGTVVINIVLLGTFNPTSTKTTISVDEKLIEPNREVDIDIAKSQSLQQIVEYVTHELFGSSEVQFTLKLPLECAAATGTMIFVNDPTCVEIVPAHRDLPSWQRLQKQMAKNVEALLGSKITYEAMPTDGINAVASKIQKALQAFDLHVSVHYSDKVNTLFISLPATEDKDFPVLFRQILDPE